MVRHRKWHLLTIVGGCVLIAALIHGTGAGELWVQLKLLGWALVPLVLMEGIADVLHTQAWRHCLSYQHRALPFFRIFCIRMAGYSINYLTPTAGMGGEVAKGVLLANGNTGVESATGIIVDKLSYALAQLIFVVPGTLLTIHGALIPHGIWAAMLTSTALLAAGMAIFLLMQKYGKLGAALRWLVSRGIGGQGIARAAKRITGVDEKLRQFYGERPRGLFLSLVWHVAGMSVGIIQCYYFLHVLGQQPSVMLAAGLWFLGTWFNLLSFAVPIDLGVMEATRVLTFMIFGLPSSLGLAYGISLRLEQLFWAGTGLFMYAVLLSRLHERHAAHAAVTAEQDAVRAARVGRRRESEGL